MPKPKYEGRSLDELKTAFEFGKRALDHVKQCALCESPVRRHAQKTSRDRYGFPVGMWQCDKCGLRYLSPRLTFKGYQEYYPIWYRNFVRAFHRQPMGPRFFARKSRIYAAAIQPLLLRHVSRRHVRMLDIGGGHGIVSTALKETFEKGGMKVSVTVMDRSGPALDVARQKGHKVIERLVEEFKPDRQQWDVLLLCKVTHHFFDPIKALRVVRNCMHEKSLLYIDFCDCDTLGVLQEEVKLGHTYYFTKETFLNLLFAAGLRPVDKPVRHGSHCGYVVRTRH